MAILLDPVTPATFAQWNGTLWVPSTWTLPTSAPAVDTGDVLTVTGANAADWDTPPVLGGTKRYHHAFGCLSLTVGTVFPGAWCQPAVGANGASTAVAETIQETGTLKTMYATHGQLDGADPIVYTVMLDNVATALTVTLSSGATGPVSDLVNTVAATAGQRLTLQATGATTTRTLSTRIQFLLELP